MRSRGWRLRELTIVRASKGTFNLRILGLRTTLEGVQNFMAGSRIDQMGARTSEHQPMEIRRGDVGQQREGGVWRPQVRRFATVVLSKNYEFSSTLNNQPYRRTLNTLSLFAPLSPSLPTSFIQWP